VIILEHEQGSPEWYEARLRIATASKFNAVMTTERLKRSTDEYIYILAANIFAGKDQGTFEGNEDTRRGNTLEDDAIAWREFTLDEKWERVGLCLSDCGRYGASPDAINREQKRGLEIKCPKLKEHIKYAHGGVVPKKYLHQIYGSLYVTGYDSWEFMSYHENTEPFMIATYATDESYLKWAEAFTRTLKEFLNDLDDIVDKMGVSDEQQQGEKQNGK